MSSFFIFTLQKCPNEKVSLRSDNNPSISLYMREMAFKNLKQYLVIWRCVYVVHKIMLSGIEYISSWLGGLALLVTVGDIHEANFFRILFWMTRSTGVINFTLLSFCPLSKLVGIISWVAVTRTRMWPKILKDQVNFFLN